MIDEEKAEEYADKILSDSKYPFIFSKEKVKEYIIKVYLDSFTPYRCPICFNPVSPCLWSADGKRKSCGCFTMSCDAPIFEQHEGESKFVPQIKWNNWVIAYRKEHPNFHREFMCKGCELEGVSCDFYDENAINCHWWRSEENEND